MTTNQPPAQAAASSSIFGWFRSLTSSSPPSAPAPAAQPASVGPVDANTSNSSLRLRRTSTQADGPTASVSKAAPSVSRQTSLPQTRVRASTQAVKSPTNESKSRSHTPSRKVAGADPKTPKTPKTPSHEKHASISGLKSPGSRETREWEIVDRKDATANIYGAVPPSVGRRVEASSVRPRDANPPLSGIPDTNVNSGDNSGTVSGAFALRVSKSLESLRDLAGKGLSYGVGKLFTPRNPPPTGLAGGSSLATEAPLPSVSSISSVPKDAAAPPSLARAPSVSPDRVEAQLDKWDRQLEQFPILTQLEKQTGIKKVTLAVLLMIGIFAVVFLGFGISVLCALVGFIYPLISSFRTIDRPEPKAVKQWLTYWVVFALFFTFESFFDVILAWIPFYNVLKLVFLVWCFLPRYQGATRVYSSLIRPAVLPLTEDIETVTDTVKDAASYTVNHVGKTIRQKSEVITGHIRSSTPQWLAAFGKPQAPENGPAVPLSERVQRAGSVYRDAPLNPAASSAPAMFTNVRRPSMREGPQ